LQKEAKISRDPVLACCSFQFEIRFGDVWVVTEHFWMLQIETLNFQNPSLENKRVLPIEFF
jgi:hypothetical protein